MGGEGGRGGKRGEEGGRGGGGAIKPHQETTTSLLPPETARLIAEIERFNFTIPEKM